jgi:hypothetical protein
MPARSGMAFAALRGNDLAVAALERLPGPVQTGCTPALASAVGWLTLFGPQSQPAARP